MILLRNRGAMVGVLLGLALVALSSRHLAAAAKLHELFGVERDDSGKSYLMHEGIRYDVFEDPEENKAWFFNTETNQATWDDPRTGGAPITTESLTVNVAPPVETKGSKITVYIIAVVPVVLFALGLAARIYYLHTYYPDLLWPTKERKKRYRSQKQKKQKQRGKMNQDGKGGRSANS